MTTAALPPAVRVWCPDWCVTDPQTHLDDLEGWEGRVIHSSDDFGRLPGEDYALTMIALPDGTPDPEEDHHTPVMCVASDGNLVHPDDMERHARALLAMVARARGHQQERAR